MKFCAWLLCAYIYKEKKEKKIYNVVFSLASKQYYDIVMNLNVSLLIFAVVLLHIAKKNRHDVPYAMWCSGICICIDDVKHAYRFYFPRHTSISQLPCTAHIEHATACIALAISILCMSNWESAESIIHRERNICSSVFYFGWILARNHRISCIVTVTLFGRTNLIPWKSENTIYNRLEKSPPDIFAVWTSNHISKINTNRRGKKNTRQSKKSIVKR